MLFAAAAPFAYYFRNQSCDEDQRVDLILGPQSVDDAVVEADKALKFPLFRDRDLQRRQYSLGAKKFLEFF